MQKNETKEVINPFGQKFWSIWGLWKEYKQDAHKFKYKSPISEQMALNRLSEISAGKEDIAIKVIETSIANQWEGLYALKTISLYDTRKQPVSNDSSRQSLNDALNKRFGDRG